MIRCKCGCCCRAASIHVSEQLWRNPGKQAPKECSYKAAAVDPWAASAEAKRHLEAGRLFLCAPSSSATPCVLSCHSKIS